MPKLVPDWIRNLEPGTYTMQELKKKLGFTRANIHKLLKKHGAVVQEVRKDGCNFYFYLYIWEGYKG